MPVFKTSEEMGKLSKKIVFILTALMFAFTSAVVVTTVFDLSFELGGVNILPVIFAGIGVVLSPYLPEGVLAYTLVSVGKGGNNPGRPVGKRNQIILFNWEDVDVDLMPARDTGGVRITGDLVFLPNKYAIELYVTPSSVNFFDTGEGDADAKGFIQTLEFEKPGDALAFSEFLENNINSNIGAIIRFCDGRTPRLLGTPCVPLQFTSEGQNNNEANKTKITLKSILPGPVIAHYAGAEPPLDTSSGSGGGA